MNEVEPLERGLIVTFYKSMRERGALEGRLFFKLHLGEASSWSPRKEVFIKLNDSQRAALERATIANARAYKPGEFGIASILLNPSAKLMEWGSFFPLNSMRPEPVRLGLGSLVHYAISGFLTRKPSYRNYRIQHSKELNYERRMQLKSMGINSREPVPLPEYHAKVERYVRSKFDPKVVRFTKDQ